MGTGASPGPDQLHVEGQESLQPSYIISTKKKNTWKPKFLGEKGQAQPLHSENEQEGM